MVDKNNDIDLRRLTATIGRMKAAYVASVVVFAAIAAIYCIVRQPQYEVRATIMIEDGPDDAPSGAGGMAAMMKTFSIGGFGASSVDNELQLVNSHDVLMRTAKALSLNRTYYERDGMRKRMLFEDSPIRVDGQESMFDTLTRSMKMRVSLNCESADITVKTGLTGRKVAELKGVTLPAQVKTPYGTLLVSATEAYSGKSQTIDVAIGSYPGAAEFLEKDIAVDKADKLSDAISFEMLYPNRERGMAILNVLMNEYNAKRLNRKHSNADTELRFLDGRIAAIFDELSEAENNIRDFKTRHKAADIKAEAPLIVENALNTRTEMVKAKAESVYLKEVLESLRDGSRSDDLLPVFDNEAYPMIRDYNNMVLEKRQLEKSALQDHPALDAADENLRQMRSSVIKNVEGMLEASTALLKTQSALAVSADARISELPEIERDYVELERDRQLKNSLYMYLVDKRESALLQLYSENTLGFIVDEAYCQLKPSRKKPILIVAVCIMLAIVCPTAAAIFVTLRRKTVSEAIDVAAYGLENNTYVTDGHDTAIATLRDRVSGEGKRSMVFVSGPTAMQTAEWLRDSFESVDMTAAILTPSMAGLPETNDSMRRQGYRTMLSELLSSNAAVVLPVADPDNLQLIKPLIAEKPGLLQSVVIATMPGATKRKSMENIVKDFGRKHTFVAISRRS